MNAGTWRSRSDLDKLLGPEHEKPFREFLDAQTAEFRALYPDDHDFEEFDVWVTGRWGFVATDEHYLRVTVYERTSQYCGSFQWDGERWTDSESEFSWPPRLTS